MQDILKENKISLPPPKHLQIRVVGEYVEGFIGSGPIALNDINKTLESSGKSLRDFQHILDFGCGIADLYPYIKDRGLNVEYTGIDIMPLFIKMAKDRYGDEIKILNTNVLYFLEKFDWVFASGVFSIGFDVNQLIEHITHFVKISNKGVCFNLLDKDKFEGDVQVSFLQNEIINTIKNKFPELNLTVVNTYSVDDFTIILKK